MSGHTYDKWQELGYQVKKGEKAAYKYYGQSIFTKDQVFKVNSDDQDKHEIDESYYPSRSSSEDDYYWDKDTSDALAFSRAGLGSKF